MILDKTTATGVLDTTVGKMYKPVTYEIRLSTPTEMASSINNGGAKAEDFTLYTGRAYKFVIENASLSPSTRISYLIVDRAYAVETVNTGSWFTEDKSGEFPVGGNFYGNTIVVSEWKNGVEVLHE